MDEQTQEWIAAVLKTERVAYCVKEVSTGRIVRAFETEHDANELVKAWHHRTGYGYVVLQVPYNPAGTFPEVK